MDIENNPSFYLATEVQELLGFRSLQSVYYARRHGTLPPGFKFSGQIKWPRHQIDAILRGDDWRSAQLPTIDESTTPKLAGETAESACDSPAGTGGATVFKLLIDHLADAVADRLEDRLGRGERHES